MDPIAITGQVRGLRGILIAEGLDELLRSPLGRRVGGDVPRVPGSAA
jgi:hypothetical protein